MPKQDTHESGQSSSDPASRFTAVYEAGLHAAPYGQVLESELLKTGWIVNLPQMQLTDDLPEKIKDLSALTLYRSLMHYGPQDCLDALEVMTPEQFTGLLDFSAWTEGDRLSLVKAAKWLDLLNNISSEVLFQHFSSLEEEVQIALLSSYVMVQTADEYEKLADYEQDQYVAMPCQTLFYKILSDDKSVQTSIQNLMAAALSYNLAYAYSLLTHAAYMPPNESEAQAALFRQSRLEEEGFVPRQEGIEFFRAIDAKAFAEETSERFAQVVTRQDRDLPIQDKVSDRLFIDQVFNLAETKLSLEKVSELLARIRFAANAVTPLSGIDAEDFAGCRNLLQQLKGFLSLGLEYFSSEQVDVALNMLQNIFPKTIMQAVTGLYMKPRQIFLQSLEVYLNLAPTNLSEAFRQARQGSLLFNLEKHLTGVIGPLEVEVVKGFYNRFPVLPEAADKTNHRFVFRAVADVRDLSEQLFKISEIMASIIYRNKLVAETKPVPEPLGFAELIGKVKEHLQGSELQWDMLQAAGLGDCSERVYEAITHNLQSELAL